MRARGDLIVFSEPFSGSYYFGAERVSDRFGEPSPDNPAPAWPAVVQTLLTAARSGTVFVKEMAYHVAPRLGPELVRNFQNTFIIRHPGRSLRSLEHLYPDFTVEEAGFEQQHRLMELAAEITDDGLIVVEAEDLRRSPASVVADYCRRVGLPLVPESLSWPAGLLADWRQWEDWHGEVAASTGITPPRDEPAPGRPVGVDPDVYATCLEHYEKMIELGRVGRDA